MTTTRSNKHRNRKAKPRLNAFDATRASSFWARQRDEIHQSSVRNDALCPILGNSYPLMSFLWAHGASVPRCISSWLSGRYGLPEISKFHGLINVRKFSCKRNCSEPRNTFEFKSCIEWIYQQSDIQGSNNIISFNAKIEISSRRWKISFLCFQITDKYSSSDYLVGWVYQDDLKVFVRRVLRYPVAVQHTETSATATDTFLKKISHICNLGFWVWSETLPKL